MGRLFKIGIVFLKNSRMMTFSAFLSIFFACFLSVSMFQLFSNAEDSFVKSIFEEYGDYRIGISKEYGEAFTADEMEYIKQNDGVTNVSAGYYISDMDGIYAVGVVDDDVNKSRYKYTYPVKEREIVINQYLSGLYGKHTDDTLSLRGQEYTVKEVLTADRFTMSKMSLLIMDMPELHTLAGNADTGMINYVLLQCEEDKDLTVITEKLQSYSERFNISCVEADKDVQTLLTAFKGLLVVLFVIVIIISGMFVASIFYEYMRKYRRDMAVMRTVGGKRRQINMIFFSMSLTISFLGCMAGATACTLFNDRLLNSLNEKMNLFTGSVVINREVLILMTVSIFVIFNVLVMVFFIARQNVLPIQVFRTAGTELRKKKNGLLFLKIRKIAGTEFYLAIKLLIPKFRQNFMFIVIIALITALSYTGQSSMQLLNENNYGYYRNLTEGFDAYGEVLSETQLDRDRIIEMTERIKAVSAQCCTIIGEFWDDSCEAEDTVYGTDDDGYEKDDNIPTGFYAANITDFIDLFHGEYMKDRGVLPEERRMLVTDKTAEHMGYELGDKVTLDTRRLSGEKEFTVVGIVKMNIIGMEETNGCIIDFGNLDDTTEQAEKNCSPYDAYFYINGEREPLEDVLQQLEDEEESFKGLIFEQVIEEGNAICMQRLAMIKMVLFVLIIVAGIGWLNSAKGLLMARKDEYRVLRMIGATRKKVRKISWIQIWSYMLSGIVLGMIIGLVSVYMIWRNNVIENVTISVYWGNLAAITLFMFALSLLLRPVINKLSR